MTVKHSFLKISIDRDMYRLLIQNMDEYAHVEATSMGISIHGHMLNKSPMQVQTQTCTISRKCSPCTTCPDCLLPYLCFLHIFIIPHTIIAHVCFNKKDVLKKVCRRNLQDVLQLLQGQAVAGKRKRLRDQKGIPKNSFIRNTQQQELININYHTHNTNIQNVQVQRINLANRRTVLRW